MEKLPITVEGKERKIEYTIRYSKGIFIVDDKKAVKRNCEILEIRLDEPQGDLHLIQKVSKIEKVSILTTRLQNSYWQYILLDYVELNDFENLLKEIPQQSKEAIRNAYNLLKMNTLADIELLGKSLDNKN
jgi:hypothetical protein